MLTQFYVVICRHYAAIEFHDVHEVDQYYTIWKCFSFWGSRLQIDCGQYICFWLQYFACQWRRLCDHPNWFVYLMLRFCLSAPFVRLYVCFLCSVCLCLCVRLSVCLSACLFAWLSVRPSACLSIGSPYLSVCLSVGLSVCLSVRPSVRLSLCLPSWLACWLPGSLDGWMDGWMARWLDRWMGEWVSGTPLVPIFKHDNVMPRFCQHKWGNNIEVSGFLVISL